VAANSTVALALTTIADQQYRVLRGVCQVMSEKPSYVQYALRGEASNEQMPTADKIVGVQRTTLSRRMPSSEGYWSGIGSGDHLAWVTNTGPNPIQYMSTIEYVRQTVRGVVSRGLSISVPNMRVIVDGMDESAFDAC